MKSPVVLRIVMAADGVPEPDYEGRYVRAYTPDGFNGQGRITVTDDIAKARLFADALDALECWRAVSKTHPLRGDGLPNRPLTAFTVEVRPLHEDRSHESPSR